MWLEINIGADYLPLSIRARSGNQEFPVEEIDSSAGTVRVDVPEDFNGDLKIDFQRSILRGGGPRADKIIGSSNACIYCGAESDLQDEHVIAYGLEGEFVLKNASCRKCADKTSKIERAVLRDTLLPARSALNLRSYHPTKRPTMLTVNVIEKAGRRTQAVSIAEHPSYIALPHFDAPAVLRKAQKPNLELKGVWTKLVGASSLTQARSKFGGSDVSVELDIDPYAFARMLGKIAHGFVAAADLGSVETELPSAVLANDESIGWWVGGAAEVTLPDQALHGFQVTIVNGLVHVRIRLFAQLGGPEYLVVAGRIIRQPVDARPHVVIEASKI